MIATHVELLSYRRKLAALIRGRRRSDMRIATVILLPLLVAGGPGCATSSRDRFVAYQTKAEHQPAGRRGSAWSRVEAIAPGVKVELLLQDDRTVRGDFQSAGDDAVTLRLPGGETVALEQREVRRVRVRRPVWRRPAGWIAFAVATGTLGIGLARAMDLSAGPMAAAMFGAPVAWPFFTSSAMATVYETPPRAGLGTRVEVGVADGDMVRLGQEVKIAVFHDAGGWPGGAPVGVTVCLSSRPTECDGARARYEGPIRDLPHPFTARLAMAGRWPTGAPLTLHVHVVITAGPSWQPTRDPQVPRLGDSGVADAVTVTRRITVGER